MYYVTLVAPCGSFSGILYLPKFIWHITAQRPGDNDNNKGHLHLTIGPADSNYWFVHCFKNEAVHC